MPSGIEHTYEPGDPVEVVDRSPYLGWRGEVVYGDEGDDGWVTVDFDGNYIEIPTHVLTLDRPGD